jgi:NTP pyrophosphatase (non-canonical NTP hydrolase)
MSDIKRITERIKQFRDERNWLQFHNHKDLALSLIIEAAELLEHFQWKTLQEANEHGLKNRKEISEEIADVAMYLFELADNLNIDLSKAIEEKLDKNALKYPVEKSKNSAKKYTEL